LSALEADKDKFADIGAGILAINPASVEAHDKYCDKKGFTFPLLSDPGRKVAKAYQATKLKDALIQRTVYVVGPGQKILFAEQGIPADKKMIDAISNDKRN
jgi:peroxiredoxin